MSADLLEAYRGKTILVTGGTGFIGSALLRELTAADAHLVLLEGRHHRAFDLPNGKAEIETLAADLTAGSFWDGLVGRVDVVFHLAAQTSSRLANAHPLEDLETNLLPVVRFVDACQRHGRMPDFVFSGTVTQVGFTSTYPMDESPRDAPVTVYDINKLAAEQYLHYYASESRGRAVTLRLANVYGPGPKSHHADRGVLNLMIRRAIANESLTVYGSGEFVRDFTYVDDVARAFLTAGAALELTDGHHYVLGSGEGHSVTEMVETVRDLVAEATGTRAPIRRVPVPDDLPRIDTRSFVADSTRFRAVTGWTPQFSLADGIARTIHHFLAEPGR